MICLFATKMCQTCLTWPFSFVNPRSNCCMFFLLQLLERDVVGANISRATRFVAPVWHSCAASLLDKIFETKTTLLVTICCLLLPSIINLRLSMSTIVSKYTNCVFVYKLPLCILILLLFARPTTTTFLPALLL
jgi:hypothetical protein